MLTGGRRGLSAQLRSEADSPLARLPELQAPAPSLCRSSLRQRRRSNSSTSIVGVSMRECIGAGVFGSKRLQFENERPAVSCTLLVSPLSHKGEPSEQGTLRRLQVHKANDTVPWVVLRSKRLIEDLSCAQLRMQTPQSIPTTTTFLSRSIFWFGICFFNKELCLPRARGD